jgi:hypothetical protein
MPVQAPFQPIDWNPILDRFSNDMRSFGNRNENARQYDAQLAYLLWKQNEESRLERERLSQRDLSEAANRTIEQQRANSYDRSVTSMADDRVRRGELAGDEFQRRTGQDEYKQQKDQRDYDFRLGGRQFDQGYKTQQLGQRQLEHQDLTNHWGDTLNESQANRQQRDTFHGDNLSLQQSFHDDNVRQRDEGLSIQERSLAARTQAAQQRAASGGGADPNRLLKQQIAMAKQRMDEREKLANHYYREKDYLGNMVPMQDAYSKSKLDEIYHQNESDRALYESLSKQLLTQQPTSDNGRIPLGAPNLGGGGQDQHLAGHPYGSNASQLDPMQNFMQSMVPHSQQQQMPQQPMAPQAPQQPQMPTPATQPTSLPMKQIGNKVYRPTGKLAPDGTPDYVEVTR